LCVFIETNRVYYKENSEITSLLLFRVFFKSPPGFSRVIWQPRKGFVVFQSGSTGRNKCSFEYTAFFFRKWA